MKKTFFAILTVTVLLSGCGISMVSNSFPESKGEKAYTAKIVRWSAAGAILFLLSGAAANGGEKLFQ